MLLECRRWAANGFTDGVVCPHLAGAFSSISNSRASGIAPQSAVLRPESNLRARARERERPCGDQTGHLNRHLLVRRRIPPDLTDFLAPVDRRRSGFGTCDQGIRWLPWLTASRARAKEDMAAVTVSFLSESLEQCLATRDRQTAIPIACATQALVKDRRWQNSGVRRRTHNANQHSGSALLTLDTVIIRSASTPGQRSSLCAPSGRRIGRRSIRFAIQDGGDTDCRPASGWGEAQG